MKKKPRILVDSFHLLQALTGIRTYTQQLCSGIEKAETEDVDYLIYPNWRWINKTNFLRGKVNVAKKLINHGLYFFWKQLCLPILIVVKRIDLVVAPDYLLPYFNFGAKGISVVHDTFYWELKSKYNPVWRWYFLKSVSLGLNKRTSIIVTSNYIGEKVKRYVSDQHKLSVVYQAPKNLKYGGGLTSSQLNASIPQNTKYFLHVGLFEDRKNLGVLIMAFSRVIQHEFYHDFKLLLIGSRGIGWFHDDFQRINDLVNDLNLADRVIMPGFMSDEELGRIYSGAFAYVFPSREEGFGIPVVEAMKAGIPVIISNQLALTEVAGGSALIFDMESDVELYDRMIQLIDPKIREELIAHGSKRALKFTQSSFFDQFHQVVLENLNNR